MHVAIIGGTGHIGSYLTPMLVESGYRVICVSRGVKHPYREHSAWKSITYAKLDREAEEKTGSFGASVAKLGADAVIDLTCYQPSSAAQLVEGLRGHVNHLIHCGTIWIHGHSTVVPTTEDTPRQPFGDYGIRKSTIESYLVKQARETGFPVTMLHPGHLVGKGWAPINPCGNFNPKVFSALKNGEEIRIPNFGMETLHHVHCEDVAQAFLSALKHRDAAVGQSFHVVSESATTLRGFAEQMGEWFGKPARIKFLPWEEWKQGFTEKEVATTEDHLRHSPNCSTQKARDVLGYKPRYTSLHAVQESVTWLIQNGIVA